MTTEMSHVRKPSVAMWLSTFCCGLGQIYCGRVGRGLVMYCLSMMFWPLVAITIFSGSTTVVLVVLAVLMAAVIVFNIWSARDARATARSMAAIDFEPREYNRPLVYGLMILTWFPYVIGLALFLRANVVEAFMLPSSSMAPTLVPGDRILTNKLGIETAMFSGGDLVVFRNPQNRTQKHIKRIVGLPGDTFEIKAGQLLINDRPLKREPVPAADETSSMNMEGKQAVYEWSGDRRYSVLIDKAGDNADVPKQTVPAGSYFVLGDHRGRSLDSREFGAISHGEIVGQVVFLYRPGDTWKRFGAIR
ncbi:MAG: signal peptidase I [Candidatus Saccharimonas sp.]|nr:signal peptidase I [Planctomycetaceae bacterium]